MVSILKLFCCDLMYRFIFVHELSQTKDGVIKFIFKIVGDCDAPGDEEANRHCRGQLSECHRRGQWK